MAEGVLDSAERGGCRGEPISPEQPLQRLSTIKSLRRHADDVSDAHLVAAIDPYRGPPGNTAAIVVNQIAAERISGHAAGRPASSTAM
ncbi:hypothetical protein [Mycolicibacterium bacteremicum]|uniref:hypothetical protein n=1 Tax=Mycolicibacterium bacteremicum TaxID=564198 RepID=UPI0010554E0F|nr:hypothetical protein [Mycolicibacterium bacteremicum]MCV7433872.1 hypothetical protein [Mycolicibacterium bacteremicum]